MSFSNLGNGLAIFVSLRAQIELHTDVLQRLVDRVILGQLVADCLQQTFAEIFSKIDTNHRLCYRRVFISFGYRYWRVGCCHCYVFVNILSPISIADLLLGRV